MCERVYAGGRGYCPIDAVELGQEHDVDLPQTGTITNFTIVTPVQYPGQTETEPFARVFVLLDGTDVVLPYQPVIELPVDRHARRHAGRGGVGVAGERLDDARQHGRRLRRPPRLDAERRARRSTTPTS